MIGRVHCAGDRRNLRARRSGFSIRVVALLATITPTLLVFLIESPIPRSDRALAALLWMLCTIPAWLMIVKPSEQRSPIPFLASIGLAYGWYYALPPTYGAHNEHWALVVDPRVDYTPALVLAIAGWVMLLLGYRLAGRNWHAPRTATPRFDLTSKSFPATVGILCILLGLPLSMLPNVIELPMTLVGASQFGSVLWLLGISLLVARHAAGVIGFAERLLLVPAVVIALGLALLSSFIAALILVWVTILFTVWAVRQSLGGLWTMVVIVAAISGILFKGVIAEFRGIQSQPGEHSLQVSAGLMEDLVRERVEREGWLGAVMHGQQAAQTRSANLELFADVIRRTPSEVPYWNGDTYLSLAGAFIPRVLWPDKPTKELGQAFGHRYSYLLSSDYATSFNLPYLVEFYANFGAVGVWIGMFLVGMIYRALDYLLNRPGQPIMKSCFGIVLLLPLLIIESDFSLIFGGLVLNGGALYLVYKSIELHSRREHVKRVRPRWTVA